jgi:hypothetical protein
MSNQHRLGPLHVRVAGHHRFAGGARLLDQRIGPCGKSFDRESDLPAHIEPQIGGDLFVAAAAGVQPESQRADALN